MSGPAIKLNDLMMPSGPVKSNPRYDSLFTQAAIKTGLAKRLGSLGHAVDLLRAISLHENPQQNPTATNTNKNGTKDHGLMMVNDIHWKRGENATDPMTNITRGAQTFIWALNRSHDDIPRALSIYNMGHYGERNPQGEFVNQPYVDSVKNIFSRLRQQTQDLAQSATPAATTQASVGPQ